MKSTHVSHLRVSALGMLGLAALASGCSAGGDPSPTDSSDAPAGPAVAEFVIHVQPRAGKISFHRMSAVAVAAQAKHVGPGLSPQAMADVNLSSDDVEGSGAANSVELVTTSVTDPRLDFDTNALGTFNVLEAVRLMAPDAVVIYASTNKVYGGMEDLALLSAPQVKDTPAFNRSVLGSFAAIVGSMKVVMRWGRLCGDRR